MIFCNKTMEQREEQDLPGILSAPLGLNPRQISSVAKRVLPISCIYFTQSLPSQLSLENAM